MQIIQSKKGESMEFIFDNERPIYIQLVEQLRLLIIAGEFQQGEKIPSVRELALIAKVNPNTMQKALVELETEGLIYTERTNGKYVTNDIKRLKTVRENIAKEKVKSFFSDMERIGMNQEDTIKYLQEKIK